jgi:hypothetical protein
MVVAGIAGLALASIASAQSPSPPIGRYSGTWNESGLSKSGAYKIDIFVLNHENKLVLRLDPDGDFLGQGDPAAANVTLSPASGTSWSGTANGTSGQGDLSVTLNTSGSIVLTCTNVTGGNISGYSVTGTINSSGVANLTGTASLTAGGSTPISISATRGFTTVIPSPNPVSTGLFGGAIAGIADVDGDGAGDIVVSGLSETASGTLGSGRVYVISGRTGIVLFELVNPNLEVGGTFGGSLNTVQDVNGDGVNDIIVGAPNQNPGGSPAESGRAYLFSGRTGTLLATLAAPDAQANAQFGWSVAGINDLNNDGKGDLIVGAPFFNGGTGLTNAGKAYIFAGGDFSGGAATFIRNVTAPTPAQDDFFGYSVVGFRDVNNDGRGDYAVAAPQSIQGSPNGGPGAVHIFSGIDGTLIRTINNPTGFSGSQFGASMALVPDVDGDGNVDLVIGSPANTRPSGLGPSEAGRVYIFNPNTGTGIRAIFSTDPTTNGHFGASVAGSADIDGDGRGDIIVGAPGELTDGRCHVFSGLTGTELRTFGSLFPTAGVGNYGFSVSRVPDTNNNGKWDILVGGSGQQLPLSGMQSKSGALYLIRN